VKKPALCRFFRFKGLKPVRTACFVDGYNLFYGLLAGTEYKWLDLPALLVLILCSEQPGSELVSIFFFTSGVKPDLASRGRLSKEAQDTYLRALIERGVHVHYGRHQLEPRLAPRFVDRKTPASRQDQIAIWKLEEKETDVHIAISMYRLAAKQAGLPTCERIGQIVLVSADTDMTPALKAIREDHPEIQVGVVLPNREGIKRTPPGSLKNYSNWMRHLVTREELAACQFPRQVPTRKKPARKPDYW